MHRNNSCKGLLPAYLFNSVTATNQPVSLCFTADSQSENGANQEAETPGENLKADTNNCPRDSGCHMPSDSSDNSTEDADPPFISERPLPAEMTAS